MFYSTALYATQSCIGVAYYSFNDKLNYLLNNGEEEKATKEQER